MSHAKLVFACTLVVPVLFSAFPLEAQDSELAAREPAEIESSLEPIATLVLENGNLVEFYEPEPGFVLVSEEGEECNESIRSMIDPAVQTPLEIYEILAQRRAPEALQLAYQRYLDHELASPVNTDMSRFADEEHSDLAANNADLTIDGESQDSVSATQGCSEWWFEENLCNSVETETGEVLGFMRSEPEGTELCGMTCRLGNTGIYQRTKYNVYYFEGFVCPYRNAVSFQLFYKFGWPWNPATRKLRVEQGRYRWAWMYHRDYSFDGRLRIEDSESDGFHVGYKFAPPQLNIEDLDLPNGGDPGGSPTDLPGPECGPSTNCFGGGNHRDYGWITIDGASPSSENPITVEVLPYLCYEDDSTVQCEADRPDRKTANYPIHQGPQQTTTGEHEEVGIGYYATCNETNTGCEEMYSRRSVTYSIPGTDLTFTEDHYFDHGRHRCSQDVKGDIEIKNLDTGFVKINGKGENRLRVEVRNLIAQKVVWRSWSIWTSWWTEWASDYTGYKDTWTHEESCEDPPDPINDRPPKHPCLFRSSEEGYYEVETGTKVMDRFQRVVKTERRVWIDLDHDGEGRWVPFSGDGKNGGYGDQSLNIHLSNPLPDPPDCPYGWTLCETGPPEYWECVEHSWQCP